MKLALIRKSFSLLILILFLLLFLGGETAANYLSLLLLPLQLAPALLHTIINPETLFVSGLIFLIALSLIFGRVYCSFLCPLGIMQDGFIFFSRKARIRRKHKPQKSYNWVRYSLLTLTAITAVSGSMILLSFLDPYSLFGRTITALGDPVVVVLRSAFAGILKYFNIYLFSRALNPVPVFLVIITIMFFLLIALMSLRYGRLYCNSVCPAGALLGLLARFSLFKIIFNDNQCKDCGRCEKVCKAGCIDTTKMQIDPSRCVNCFNCLKACPQATISYRPSLTVKSQKGWSPSRRGFIFGLIAAAGSLALTINSGIRNVAAETLVKREKMPVTPPGSGSIAHFTHSCSACHLCVNVCPTKVLAPSLFAYGIGGFMQPELNFEKSYCDFECNACGKVCPTGAIMELPLAEKKQTQIGVVELLKDKCTVYLKDQNCGACGEVCPTHAIYSVNKNNVLYPEIDTNYCIGCGACQKACPTDPKSIIVQSNLLHKKAAKYIERTKAILPKKEDKDFPF